MQSNLRTSQGHTPHVHGWYKGVAEKHYWSVVTTKGYSYELRKQHIDVIMQLSMIHRHIQDICTSPSCS